MTFAAAMLVALAIDTAIGWPDWLYRRIGHPVTWIGALISALDSRWNRTGSRRSVRRGVGALATLLVIAVTGGLAAGAQALLPAGWPGIVLTGVLAWPLVACRSLGAHVDAVARPLAASDLAAARRAVAMIVGRDPALLDHAGVARAAMESLAENTSDGVVAPLFWGLIAGLPGIAAYKAINTLDSMIGHRTPRHEAFGWAAARIDDMANLIPARLTALLFALASGRPGAAWRCVRRDARRHRSPNAGWPEAAMAGALHVRLSGPRVYADRVADEPWINADAPDPDAGDLIRALALYRRAMALMALLLALALIGL
ncbi:adenosylcobinamide-phosphate synthase CbiB [Pararhodobacter sp. SW119]|uniref:adenosylcobinamide-phosphate synthase CbiB n=1 Tax=Pararhodobacter sp. SW119 TaxID=2780075 RepID=UPI001AE033E8|nr:adenosylcobinamide-phosphate synthase CbiB [Pararhodobacter sp. SW119]